MIETMRRLLLFETLSDEQLQWLAEHASEVTFTAGELIFSEGKPADALWVLIAGEWRLSRQIGGFETPLVTTAQPGTWGGGMPVAGGIHQISARATRASRMLRIPDAAVKHMLDSGFPITRHLLAGITIGARRLEALQSEHEKLTALGKLAAGLAHELNNPAAAARRAGAGLRQVLRDQQDAVLALVPADVAERWRARLESLGDEIAAAIKAAQPGSPLERSEREDAIAAWLDDHEVPEGYDAAPTLVDAGLDVDWLERLAGHAPPEALPDLIRWVVVTAMGLLLGDQLEHSTTRISELIGAVKSYSYMDEAPLQEVDVHEGLENTLMMLGH